MSADQSAPRREPAHRATIALEDGRIVAHEHHEAEQHVVRLAAPRIAARAAPGQFVHLRCEGSLAMRRPLSIMRADAGEGWLELLYKEVGRGTRALAAQQPGATLSALGPIGMPFRVPPRARPLLLGGGVGIPPMVFLAERLREHPSQPLVVLGSEVPFPFEQARSALDVPGVTARGAMALLESSGIPSRLATLRGYPDAFDGYVTDLARCWLDALDPAERGEVVVMACGPTPMLRASAALAAEYGLASQLCLEEYMACAVGGCAGCTVPVRTAQGRAMKRVCVDGPVFDGAAIDWDAIG